MKRLFLFLFLFQTINFIAQNNKSIGFIENKGQIVDQNLKENKKVKYLLNTPGLNVQIREKGFSYDIYEAKKVPLTKKDKEFYGINRDSNTESNNFPEHSLKYSFHRIDIDFVNANQDSKIIAEEKSSDYDNYYNVTHVPEGITEVHKFQKVIYQNIYNNIDVVFFIPKDSTKVVEYNFIVRPGGKISDIKLKFNGVKTALIDNKIRMKVKFGEMEETIPLSWIENKNEKEEIKITYKEISKNTFSFNSNIDANNKTIVIDPTPIRLWGTYYSGNGGDYSTDICNDNFNNVYISGSTGSTDNIATQGTFTSSSYTYYNGNGFIVKFNTNGQRIWGTYYCVVPKFLNVDSNFNILFGGYVGNNVNDVTTPNSHQPQHSGYYDNAYLVKLNSLGLRDWGTYYGGNSSDRAFDVCFDNQNYIYMVGKANSLENIATQNSYQENHAPGYLDSDGFIVKFDTYGNRIWGTYFGGNQNDEIKSINLGNDGNIYITGFTRSSENISTNGSYNENLIGYNSGLIAKFNPDGNKIWGSYFNGLTFCNINKSVLKNNYLYIIGVTNNPNNINSIGTFNESFQHLPLNYGNSSYIAKFDIINQSLVWGTYFGEIIQDIAVNSSENIFFHGCTTQTSGISTPGAYKENPEYSDSYTIKLNENGQRVWGTYFGGNYSEGYNGADKVNNKISIDNNDSIYLLGNTDSTIGISSIGSHQENPTYNSLGGIYNTYLAKFQDCLSSPQASAINPCIGSDLELSASGGTNYLWTGPNGFTSTDQNPTIPNATALNSGQYSCEITGTGGCDNTVTVNVIVGDNLAPIPDTQNLPNINGDCNTVISTFPTATDNCSGSITATTTDPLSYSTSGNHIITWIYDDGNGNTATQTQNIIISSVADPTMNSPQEFCFQDNSTLNDIAIIGQNITWYDAQTNGNILPNTTALVDGTNYYASQTINGCESNRIPVSTTIHNTPVPTTTQNTQSFCSTENATLNSISINGSSILWYDSINSTIPLSNSTLLTDGTTYYASQTLNNCESINRLAITIQLINTLNANNYSEIICDDLNNETENVNLSDYESNLLNSTGNIYSYYHTLNGAENQISSDLINNYSNYDLGLGNNTFYVRIESPNTCYQIVELTLTLIEKPKANITDIMPICEGSSITISANNGYDSYLWSTGETTSSISVSQPGNYNVVINQNHGSTTCSSTYTFTVVNSNVATINSIQSEDWTENENYIQINVSGAGDYEYSINGIDYQESNLFSNLPSGEYSIYVRDKNGCGIVSEDIYLLMYPKFFTPNGDGFNDTWKIKFSKNEPNLTIKIFDRYGKFLKQVSPLSEGWDGTYLGQPLPSNDYWFVIIRENGKEYKGHFTLKR